MRSARRPTIAVIGAGVGACSLLASLRRGGWPGPLLAVESGRAPGGRTATRRSRDDHGLRLDHGAPLFNIVHEPPPALVEPLLELGAIGPFSGGTATLASDGTITPGSEDPLLSGRLYRGLGGMDRLCRGLVQLAEQAGERLGAPAPALRFGVLARQLVPLAGGGWQLLDHLDQPLLSADWLVLASTLPAHPRTRLLLDWPEAPLRAAARILADPQLDHALASIASIRSQPRSNLLLVPSAAQAEAWRRLPFRLLSFDALAQQRWGLSRLSIQDLDDGRMAVVAHSTAVFAAEFLSVYGTGSAIARVLGTPPRLEEEQAVIAALLDNLSQAMAGLLPAQAMDNASPRLMRWGAALPERPGLPPDLSLCPQSRVAFCGDYLELPGFGRVEGALRSGESLAARLLRLLEPC
jgi:predicted NAD/FAD-dependent oxidoreductase